MRIQELLDHALHPRCARDEPLEPSLALWRRLAAHHHDASSVQDRIEGVAQVVAEHADEQLSELDGLLGLRARFLFATEASAKLLFCLRALAERRTKRVLELFAVGDFLLERLLTREALGRNDVRVVPADVEEP